MPISLRGRFVEGEPAVGEEGTGFLLEDVTVVEGDAEETSDFDPEGETIDLEMPSAVAVENWAGREVEVAGNFEQKGGRWVFVVEEIDEV